MPRHAQFTAQRIVDELKAHNNRIQDTAAALGISRQALLTYRKKPEVVALTGGILPPPTALEKRNKEFSRERKAELTARARAPTLDEITEAVIQAFTALREINRVRNTSAATIAQLRQENERLKGRLALLDKAEEQKRAFKLAVEQDGVITPIKG